MIAPSPLQPVALAAEDSSLRRSGSASSSVQLPPSSLSRGDSGQASLLRKPLAPFPPEISSEWKSPTQPYLLLHSPRDFSPLAQPRVEVQELLRTPGEDSQGSPRFSLAWVVALLVEDDPVSSAVMTRLLQSMGVGTVLSSLGLLFFFVHV